MPIKKKPQITAWSFSRKTDYDKCPLFAKLKYVDRLPVPQSPPMIRGQKIHKIAEKHVLATGRPKLPKELELFPEEFKHLRKIRKRCSVEKQFAITSKWAPTDWFSRDAWLRAKIDLCYVDGDVLRVIDYKTGKVRRGNNEQLDTYAAIAIVFYPNVEVVAPEFWYLDEGEIVVREVGGEERPEYSADECRKLQGKLTKAVKPMLTDRVFKPTPSRLCGWCDFRKAKGGPCKY